MSFISCDFETRAVVDLRTAGVYRYARDRFTDLWCMAWAAEGAEPQIWTPGDPFPDEIAYHIAGGGTLRAWNAAFERIIWNEIGPRYGFPIVNLEQWVCSAAEAAAMSLPRSLDDCARVTGVKAQKDAEGYALMLRMTRPRKWKPEEMEAPVWWEEPVRLARLYEYCKQDVRTEQAIIPVLRRLTPRERQVYVLDQVINDRGIPLDRQLVTAAKEIAVEGVERANVVLSELTGGAVPKATNHAKLRQWVNEQGVEAESLDKAAVRDLLESDLSPNVRKVIELRAEAGKSSLAKLDSMLECVCSDNFIRGLLLYHGAGTGRWSGRLVQPQNFARGTIDGIERFIPDVLSRSFDRLNLYDNPLEIISSMMRAMICAPEGFELMAADKSAIEARVLNWLAGQTDMIENFRAYDAGDKSRDPYVQNAMRLYGLPFEAVQKFPHRQTGKFQELGCGYGMGHKKAVTAAKDVYGLTITEEQAQEIVSGYRLTHHMVVNYWHASNRAALDAVLEPGTVQAFGPLGNCKFTNRGAYLYLILPSGRPLCYAKPKIVERKTPWGEMRPAVEISASDAYTRQWGRMALYGGLIVENIVQATARDLLVEDMFALEAKDYPVILNVHDELVSLVREGRGDVKEFEKIMSTAPTWAAGLPIAAEGWRGRRYRK